MSGKDAYKSLNFLHTKQPIMSEDFASLNTISKSIGKKFQPSHFYHRKFYSLKTSNKGNRTILDEGLILIFKEPKSFTGESKIMVKHFIIDMEKMLLNSIFMVVKPFNQNS